MAEVQSSILIGVIFCFRISFFFHVVMSILPLLLISAILWKLRLRLVLCCIPGCETKTEMFCFYWWLIKSGDRRTRFSFGLEIIFCNLWRKYQSLVSIFIHKTSTRFLQTLTEMFCFYWWLIKSGDRRTRFSVGLEIIFCNLWRKYQSLVSIFIHKTSTRFLQTLTSLGGLNCTLPSKNFIPGCQVYHFKKAKE